MNSKNENVYTTTLFEDVNCNTVLDLEILEYVSENTGARFWGWESNGCTDQFVNMFEGVSL